MGQISPTLSTKKRVRTWIKNVGFNEKKTKTKTKIFKKKFSIVMNSPVITGKDNGQEWSLRLKNCNVCKGMRCL